MLLTHGARYRHYWFAACLWVLLLTGCASEPEGSSNPGDPSVAIPLDETEEFLQQCLEGEGWTVKVKYDGSLLMSYPSEQAAAFQRSMADCQAQADKSFPPKELDRHQIERAYDAELTNRDCLVREGYEIEQPPSLQVFIDTIDTNRWTAFASVPQDLPEDDYRRILLKCTPPTME